MPIAVLDDLTSREQELVDAARGGTVLVCTDLTVDELASSDDPAHCVRTEVIRELLLGRRGELDPRGIRLQGARVVGVLDLNHLRGTTGLHLERCAILDTITAERAHLLRLSLSRSRIGRLRANGMRVDDDLFFDGLRATGLGGLGAIHLPRAHIGGIFSLSNAEIINDTGPALFADGLQVDDNLVLKGLRATGSGERGTIRLRGARIGGQFRGGDAEIVNDTGPAFTADYLQVDGSLILRGLRATGSGEQGTIHLLGAHIGKQLDLDDAEVISCGGQTLNFQEARVEGAFIFPIGLVCPEAMRTTSCPHPDRIVLTDFTFGTLQQASWRDWLHLIRCHTTDYRPSPYQQLAGAERAAGHDSNTRRILIAQQQDIYRRNPAAIGSWWVRRFHWLWGVLAGYGYHVRYTTLALFLALAAAGVLGYWAGQVDTRPGHHAAERTLASATPGSPCSSIELIGLGIDRGLPLGVTGLRTRCDLDTTTRRGQAFTVAIWLIQAAIWALATLAIASYTGLIRKPT